MISLQTVRGEYEDAVRLINSKATTFGLELRSAVKANDGMSFWEACQGFAMDLQGFEISAGAIRFPKNMQSLVAAVIAADKTLSSDLEQVGTATSPKAWGDRWRSDVVHAQTAHDTLTNALGLPNDRFLTLI